MSYLNRVLNNVSLTREMTDWYSERTNLHIKLVQKYLKKIQALNLPEVDSTLLTAEMDHDTGKWVFPEYEPYVHINWKYRQLRHGIDYQVPDEVNETDATFHHVKTHKHHPEYWDDEATVDSINPKNRDKPSGKLVDATRMPLTYVASMMADWLAMSEEKGTDVRDWIKMNVNIRWKFSLEQITLMYVIVRDIPVERESTIEQLDREGKVMAYSRWSNSKWYTLHSCSSGRTRGDQVFCICGEGDNVEFTYAELKADLDGCMKKIGGDQELVGYVNRFMSDIERDFKDGRIR